MTVEGRGPVVVGLVRHQPVALTFAIAEAVRRGSDVRIVHAVWLSAMDHPSDKDEQRKAEGQAVLDLARQFVERSEDAPTVEYVLSARPPITTLTSESESAACLVVGADGTSWFDRLLGGEVVTWVVRHAACPVFVVPESTTERDPSGDVLVAVDVEAVSLDALRAAFEAAALRGSQLRVLHVVPVDLSRESTRHAWAELDRVLADEAQNYPDVHVVANVIRGHADDALVEATGRAALLVLGRPRGIGAARPLSHPVALHVVRETQCPVLIQG